MKRSRTADDRVLALLALRGRPLERGEIAAELNWSHQRVAQVLGRLVDDKAIKERAGQANGGGAGRPAALYALPAMEIAPPAPSKHPYFEPDTIVVTPSDREARVLVTREDHFVEFEYLWVRPGHEKRGVLHAKLLRAFQAGRERPDPVRINGDSES